MELRCSLQQLATSPYDDSDEISGSHGEDDKPSGM
jgi:hypothetical protein